MEQQYFLRVPTILGLQGTREVMPQKSANTTTDKRVNFVLKYYEVALKVGKLFNLHPLVILAQASVESGWGTSKLALENNNFFGITAYGSPNQYWKGDKRISSSSGLPFRSYRSVEDGFSDFARIITRYYKQAASVSNNINAYAEKIASSPYINEKNGDNRSKYKSLIIASAETILGIAKKKFQSLFN